MLPVRLLLLLLRDEDWLSHQVPQGTIGWLYCAAPLSLAHAEGIISPAHASGAVSLGHSSSIDSKAHIAGNRNMAHVAALEQR